jgi:Skp family chaperone for outer membrane proteins
MKSNFILAISVAFVFAACGGKEKEKENTTPNVPTYKNGLKMAFYIQDSLKSGFHYFRELDSTTTLKQTKFQNELERRQRSLQEYVLKNDQLAKSGQLSNIQIASVQQEAQRQEQALYQYQQTEGAKLEEETVELLNVLSKRVEAAAKKYCEEHKLDMLLSHGANGQFTYINPTMDVTKEFIAYLNEHQSEIESTVVGKDKKK